MAFRSVSSRVQSALQIVFRSRRLRALAATVLVGVSAYYVVHQIGANWGELTTQTWHISPLPLVASFVLLLIALFVAVWVWWMSLQLLEPSVPYRHMFQAWAIPNLAKYIPGGIWAYAGSVAMLVQSGKSALGAAASVGLVQIFVSGTGVLLSFPLLLQRDTTSMAWLVAGGLLLATVVVVFWPQLVLLTLKRVSRTSMEWGAQPIPRLRLLSVKALLGAIVYWFLVGFAFCLFVGSVQRLSGDAFLHLVSVFAGAQTAGLLVLVAPAGLGVREAVMTALLSQLMPPASAALIALLSRVWFVVAEVICLVIAVVDAWYRSRAHSPAADLET